MPLPRNLKVRGDGVKRSQCSPSTAIAFHSGNLHDGEVEIETTHNGTWGISGDSLECECE